MSQVSTRLSNHRFLGNLSGKCRALIFGTAVVSVSLATALAPLRAAIAAANAGPATRGGTGLRPRAVTTTTGPSTRRTRPVAAPVPTAVVAAPEAAEPIESPAAAPVGLDEEERRLLHSQVMQMRDDQRARAAQIAQLARDPRVLRSQRLLPIATRLAQQQLEASLVMQRTDRFIASTDPRLKAYEAALGEEIVQLNRFAHVLFVAAQVERIEFEATRDPRPATQ